MLPRRLADNTGRLPSSPGITFSHEKSSRDFLPVNCGNSLFFERNVPISCFATDFTTLQKALSAAGPLARIFLNAVAYFDCATALDILQVFFSAEVEVKSSLFTHFGFLLIVHSHFEDFNWLDDDE